MLKVGSFFAGIGGICLAFKNAGYELVWSNEIDKAACKTYRKNFHHQLIEGDICNLKPENLSKVDVITGGFPCQAFSIAGYRKGFEDPRGKLFFQMLKFIDEFQPRVLFFENVRYLKTHNNGNTYFAIKKALEDRGYYIADKVLDTCECSILPQHRQRFYMVCFRNEKQKDLFEKVGWPKPINENQRLTFDEIVDKSADSIHYFENYPHYYYTALKAVDDKKAFYQWRRVYCRKNKSGVCPTLTANMGGGGHNVPLVMDERGFRRLTPEECLRLQGFDDKIFLFPDDISMGNKYKQVGNSVSVPVVQAIAESIRDILDRIE
jgi:DNA (cytosine-5)-methyltransferase 1|nr:MAG TPA: Cytosine specific methyltransferase [Caudoviricetes sp.]DAY95556.1 MAG TPA: Cytosine specific methyltransferase [Caudoviricetes sp.]